MKLITKLHAEFDRYAKEGTTRFKFSFYSSDMSNYGYLFIRDIELEVDAPSESELVLKQIEALRLKEQKLQAETHKICEVIRDEIQKLLCIEDKSGSEGVT